MWIISLPLAIAVSKKKDFPLNLNHYRNAHHFTLNKAKENFHELAKVLIAKSGIPRLERLTLEYIVYPGNRQIFDVNNICSVADKFFSDSLVKCEVLKDDNYKFIAESQFRFGCIDRENPRVDVIIRSPDIPSVAPEVLKESEQSDMKISTVITLTALDMSVALREFMDKRGVTVPDGDFALTLDNGTSGYQVRFEKGESEPAKPHKKQKMEPKAAMEELNKAIASKTPDVAVENLGAIKTSEVVNKEPPPVATETLPFDATKTVASSPAPEAAAAPGAKEEVKEAAPEAKPAEPAPAVVVTKAPSLFAAFVRPKNDEKK